MPVHFIFNKFSRRSAKRGSQLCVTCEKQKWKLVCEETYVCRVEMGCFPLIAIEVSVGYKIDMVKSLNGCVGILVCLVANYKC